MVKAINKLRPKFTTHADGSDAVIFMHELVGEEDGPTVGISASIHGNENTGSQAMLDLYRKLKDMQLKGRVILLPVANPRSFAVNHRHNPLDQMNLNREFPGDPRGTYSQQLADALANEFFAKIDYNLDLHSGTDRPTVDYVYIWNDEKLSRAFGSKVLYRPVEGKAGTVYSGTSKSVSMDRHGTKVVTIELGGGIVDQTPYVERDRGGPAEPAARHRLDRGRSDAQSQAGRRHRTRRHPPQAWRLAGAAGAGQWRGDQGRRAARPRRQPL